jgi:LacI family transcriptional regulator
VGTISGRPSLHDVARMAGVSRSTVSRVLTGAANVSPEAVGAVRAATRKLGYRPDPIARAMRSGSSGCIGMVVPEIGNPFFAELVEAIERELQAHDVELMITDSRDSVQNERRRIESLLDRRVDGLIVIPVESSSSAPALEDVTAIPIVLLDRKVDSLPGDFVGVDNAAGIRAVLQHVAAQGARTVVFVSGDASTSTGASRLNAFHAQVADLVGTPPVHRLGSFTVEFGQKATGELLAEGALPDAIVCGSDVVAIGVLHALSDAGVGVPDDVLVTGFDGIRLAHLMRPTLTTVSQPIADLAVEAVRLVLMRIGGDTGPTRRSEIAPTLHVRQSSTRRRSEFPWSDKETPC